MGAKENLALAKKIVDQAEFSEDEVVYIFDMMVLIGYKEQVGKVTDPLEGLNPEERQALITARDKGKKVEGKSVSKEAAIEIVVNKIASELDSGALSLSDSWANENLKKE